VPLSAAGPRGHPNAEAVVYFIQQRAKAVRARCKPELAMFEPKSRVQRMGLARLFAKR
jgi:hypothetical protein